MARLPYNIERVRDGYGYRYRGYARDGYCVRLTRVDKEWSLMANATGHYIGRAKTLQHASTILKSYDVMID